jgi:small GTP-binding protein
MPARLPNRISLILLGTLGSGKSSLAAKLQNIKDYVAKPTIGLDVSFPEFPDPKNKDKKIRLQIWDTAGNELYKSYCRSYIKDSKVLCFTVDSSAGANLDNQFYNIEQTLKDTNKNSCFVLVMTKIDELKTEEELQIKETCVNKFIERMAKEENITFTLQKTSAKNNLGIAELLKLTLNYENILEQQKQARLFPDRQHLAIENICKKYEKIIKSRIFYFTDKTRTATLSGLTSNLTRAKTDDELKQALIDAVKDIRTPTNNKLKYGVTLFFGLMHIGDYKTSELYKLIERELRSIDPVMAGKLDQLSTPPITAINSAGFRDQHRRVQPK